MQQVFKVKKFLICILTSRFLTYTIRTVKQFDTGVNQMFQLFTTTEYDKNQQALIGSYPALLVGEMGDHDSYSPSLNVLVQGHSIVGKVYEGVVKKFKKPLKIKRFKAVSTETIQIHVSANVFRQINNTQTI